MPASDRKDIFVNVPFDRAYEPLFVTLIGALVFLGQRPHTVLEIREEGDGRLKRIIDLIRACPMSIHDLSRVSAPARFNMPFELGLASALKLFTPDRYDIFVMDAVEHRLDRTLSDYKGRDPLIHNGTCDGVLGCLLDTFQSDATGSVDEFRGAARSLRKVATLLKADLKATSLFRPSLVLRLGVAATKMAKERQFIRP